MREREKERERERERENNSTCCHLWNVSVLLLLGPVVVDVGHHDRRVDPKVLSGHYQLCVFVRARLCVCW